MANLHTEAEVARVMGLKFVTEAVKVEHAAKAGKEFQPPTVPASRYKLFATEYSKRLANASMDIGGPGTQIRVRTEDAPMVGVPVDLPLHGDRHHRWRCLGDPAQHHRPSRPRPAQELLRMAQ